MDLPISHDSLPSRRSQPFLPQFSVIPLTPQFALDEPLELANAKPEKDHDTGYRYALSTGTSYLSSASVPSTPPLLTHSRNGSFTRSYGKGKGSSRVLSDTSLHTIDIAQPFYKSGQGRDNVAPAGPRLPEASGRRDSEWLLRTGAALASSTREEKGQSWLIKRESSTSLVSDVGFYDGPLPCKERNGSRAGSSIFTPAACSRRGSYPHGGSRQASGASLAMTSFGTGASPERYRACKSSSMSEHHDIVPDFVDENLRAEMASIRLQNEETPSLPSGSFSDFEDELNESEMRRLTRESGFGLGNWIDRLIDWALFGIEDEWPMASAGDLSGDTGGGGMSMEDSLSRHADDDIYDQGSQNNGEDDRPALQEGESPILVEIPGEKGGWADARWLLHVAKGAIL